MLNYSNYRQRGDTIVEVLFAVVMIGITLAVSFSIANRNLQITRASQEQAEALKVAESKMELVKIGHKTNVGSMLTRNDTEGWCILLKNSGGINIVDVNTGKCDDKTVFGDDNGLYTVRIDGPQSPVYSLNNPPTYRVEVNWDRIGTDSTERGSVVLYYRPGEL